MNTSLQLFPMKPLSVVTVDFRSMVRLAVDELAHQELELDAARVDITAPLREKRKQAFSKLNEARRKSRRGRQSTVFTTASMNRFETAAHLVDTADWTMENPPRLVVLKVPGSGMSKDMVPESWGNRGFWVDHAPTFKSLMSSFDKLTDRWLAAYGEELNAICCLQFQDWGNPHLNLLMTMPSNEDGTEKLSNAPTGKGARNAKFNGKRPWEWIELNWADILGVRSDITSPSEHGVSAWVPRDDERERANSMEDYVGRFVGYMRLGNDLIHAGKRHQQVVPWQWRDPAKPQQVNFWRIVGFTYRRRTPDAPQRFEIHTKAAERATFRYLAKLADRERTFKEIDGVIVETSFWSTDRTRLRGGTLDRPLTELEVLELRRIISFFNKVADAPATYATAEFPPAPWERADFDEDTFLASLDEAENDMQDFRADVEEVENIRPFKELLELCGMDDIPSPDTEFLASMGFSKAEQRRAERTAKRRAHTAALRALEDQY